MQRKHFLIKKQNAQVAKSLAQALADSSTSTAATRTRRRRPTRTSNTAQTRRLATTPSPTDTNSNELATNPTVSGQRVQQPVLSSSQPIAATTSTLDPSSTQAESTYSYSWLSSFTSASSNTQAFAAQQTESSSALSKPAKNAVIAIAASVGGAILLGICAFCVYKRRKRSSNTSPNPSPLIGSFDEDRKSFNEYSATANHSNYPAADNAYHGRPLSFLQRAHETLRSQDQLFQSAKAPMSQVGAQSNISRLTQDDPFRFGFGGGSTALRAALAGDLATMKGDEREVLQQSANQPYSEGNFSRQKSVKFNQGPPQFMRQISEESHPYTSSVISSQRASQFSDAAAQHNLSHHEQDQRWSS